MTLALDQRRWNWLLAYDPDPRRAVQTLIDAAVRTYLNKWAVREERDVERWLGWRAGQIEARDIPAAQAARRARRELATTAAAATLRALARVELQRRRRDTRGAHARRILHRELLQRRVSDLRGWLDRLPAARPRRGRTELSAAGLTSRLERKE